MSLGYIYQRISLVNQFKKNDKCKYYFLSDLLSFFSSPIFSQPIFLLRFRGSMQLLCVMGVRICGYILAWWMMNEVLLLDSDTTNYKSSNFDSRAQSTSLSLNFFKTLQLLTCSWFWTLLQLFLEQACQHLYISQSQNPLSINVKNTSYLSVKWNQHVNNYSC